MLLEEEHRSDLERTSFLTLTALLGMSELFKQLDRFAVDRIGSQKLLCHHTDRREPFGDLRR
jgi:hypothetical protein